MTYGTKLVFFDNTHMYPGTTTPQTYEPGKTKSLTNSLVFDRIRVGKRPLVPVSAKTVRSLIWTPDASRSRHESITEILR